MSRQFNQHRMTTKMEGATIAQGTVIKEGCLNRTPPEWKRLARTARNRYTSIPHWGLLKNQPHAPFSGCT
jgi:hypothetical protein